MTIEIVDVPMENGGSFHSYVNVYQRVPSGYRDFPWFFFMVILMVIDGDSPWDIMVEYTRPGNDIHSLRT